MSKDEQKDDTNKEVVEHHIEPETSGSEPEPASPLEETPIEPTRKKKFDLKAFIKTKKGKVTLAVVIFVVLVAGVFAIPASRYAVAGVVLKKDLTVQVTDSKTGKPVSTVLLSTNGQSTKTDGSGKAVFHNVPVGSWQVSAKKTYYKDVTASTLVPILSAQSPLQLTMDATGRQVPLSVTNKITGVTLAGVEITAGSSTVTTADDGTATIILPADKPIVSATFKLNNYNTTTADITVTEQQDPKNSFGLTAAGKVYFLSKRTGTINVMKSNLDGANATVAVTGTGKESDSDTVLLAARDWKYLALQATRDSDTAKLYLISTADDKMSVIDEGDKVRFSPIGWSDKSFIYKVTRDDVPSWQPKQQSLKSFNAETGKITTLDDSDAVGGPGSYSGESYTGTYILNDQIFYGKYWYNAASGKKAGVYSVKANGDAKQTVKDFDATAGLYINTKLYHPNEVYVEVSGSPNKYYAYEDGKLGDTTEVNDDNFYSQAYPTYLVSPTSKYTFWYESRDGKKVSFVGDASGANSKQVLADDAFQSYGWYTDDYLLFSKNDSELYILPRDNPKNIQPIKITDYHKPSVSFPGYGYGYGGGN